MLKSQTIPNSSFENWSNQGTFENPTGGWFTANGISTQPYPDYGVSKTTDRVDGLYAAKLVTGIVDGTVYGMGIDTTAILSTGFVTASGPIYGFPYNQRPLTLKFYYKYFPVNDLREDTARIYVVLEKWDAIMGDRTKIGKGYLKLVDSVPNYTQGIINISYNSQDIPDTATIDITSSLSWFSKNTEETGYTKFIGSTLFIDKLEFETGAGISEESVSVKFNVYPNPASDIINLNISGNSNIGLTLNIYDVMGALVKSETLKQNQQQINIGNLSNGIYMVEIKSKEWTEKQKLIIQR